MTDQIIDKMIEDFEYLVDRSTSASGCYDIAVDNYAECIDTIKRNLEDLYSLKNVDNKL